MMSTMLHDFPTPTIIEQCRDVHLDNGEAIRELFTSMLRTDGGGHFFLAVCQASGCTLAELAERSEVHLDALEAFCRGEGVLSRAAFAKACEASIQMVMDPQS